MNVFINQKEGRPRAGWRLAGQLFLMYLIGTLFIILLAASVPLSSTVLFPIGMAAGAAISVWCVAKGLDKRNRLTYGIPFKFKSLAPCLIGFGVAGSAMGVIFGIEYAAGWLTITGYGWASAHHPAFLLSLLGYFLWMCIVGIYEELVFRGYQIINLAEGLNLRRIDRKQAAIGAAALSSLVFGLLHLFNPDASWLSTLNVALAGGMLAFPFLITGRLSLSIGVHIGWNFFQGAIYGFPVSGLANHTSLLQIQQHGSRLITGGGFGPEAGLMGLAGMLIVVLAITAYFKHRNQSLQIHPTLGIYHALDDANGQ